MKLRTLKRRHDARTLHRWHFLADLRAEMMIEDWQWEPCEDWDDDQDEAHCFDCGELHDMCECHIGDECGRWRNGRLSDSCSKAGSEECDFECPYNR